jgi:hypothetical protein
MLLPAILGIGAPIYNIPTPPQYFSSSDQMSLVLSGNIFHQLISVVVSLPVKIIVGYRYQTFLGRFPVLHCIHHHPRYTCWDMLKQLVGQSANQACTSVILILELVFGMSYSTHHLVRRLSSSPLWTFSRPGRNS